MARDNMSQLRSELVEASIESFNASNKQIRELVEMVFQPKSVSSVDTEILASSTDELRKALTSAHVSHDVLRRLERRKLSLMKSISFRSKIYEMSEARYLDGVLRPTWKLDLKNKAYDFADSIGTKRPDSDKQSYSFESAPRKTPGVLKATRATGSRGCYLLYANDHIVHVRDGAVLNSFEELEEHARALMTSKRNPVRDNWMWEELILEDVDGHIPARDLKFYVFYGEVVIMRESVKSGAETKVAFWDKNSVQTDMGHSQDYDFEPVGFTQDEAEIVQGISLQIPHPYLRIDMLKSEDGLVLGEFTPRPGNFDEFNDEWDRKLGEAWVRAESRLMRDLLNGKSFKPFLESTKLLD